MKLSQEAIEEFKAIYKEEFGVLLTNAEAEEMGLRVLSLFQIISAPLPSEKDSLEHK